MQIQLLDSMTTGPSLIFFKTDLAFEGVLTATRRLQPSTASRIFLLRSQSSFLLLHALGRGEPSLHFKGPSKHRHLHHVDSDSNRENTRTFLIIEIFSSNGYEYKRISS